MAKRPDVGTLKNVRKLTEPTELPVGAPEHDAPATGRTVATGIGLKESELRELDQIATETNLARNSLMRLAIRRFIQDWRAGRVDLAEYTKAPSTKKRLNF
jgi:hypothetical protein